MYSISRTNEGIRVGNRTFSSVSQMLEHFNVSHDTAEKLLKTGFSLNEIINRNHHFDYFKTASSALERGFQNPKLFGKPTYIPSEKPRSTTVDAKFKGLKEKHDFIKKELNELHKLCDESASSYYENKKARCMVFNTLPRLHNEIAKAATGRWDVLSQEHENFICHIEDVLHGGVGNTFVSPSKTLNDIRLSHFLVIYMPSVKISENLKTSLGILLRQRYNQERVTLILTARPFFISTLDFPTFLTESFSEYGKELKIIDANPSVKI